MCIWGWNNLLESIFITFSEDRRGTLGIFSLFVLGLLQVLGESCFKLQKLSWTNILSIEMLILLFCTKNRL